MSHVFLYSESMLHVMSTTLLPFNFNKSRLSCAVSGCKNALETSKLTKFLPPQAEINKFKSKHFNKTVNNATDSNSFRHIRFFEILAYAHPLTVLSLFNLIRFMRSKAYLISSIDNSSIFISTTTGFFNCTPLSR